MNINLGTQWEEFITGSIKSGRYLSASEVVRDGLRLLQEQEQVRQLRLRQLRREIDKGTKQLDRGEYLELDASGLKRYAEEVKTRGRQRLMSEAETNKTSAISKVSK